MPWLGVVCILKLTLVSGLWPPISWFELKLLLMLPEGLPTIEWLDFIGLFCPILYALFCPWAVSPYPVETVSAFWFTDLSGVLLLGIKLNVSRICG